MSTIVEVKDLVKKFDDLVAVDQCPSASRPVRSSASSAPTAPARRRRSRLISCLIDPTEGEVVVDGNSTRSKPTAVKATLGVVRRDVALYPTLSAAENLAFWARMYGLSGTDLKQAVHDASNSRD